MKILKTVLICFAVAVPVAFGAFHYGRMVISAQIEGAASHEENRHGKDPETDHDHGDEHEREHEVHEGEHESHGTAEAETHGNEAHVLLSPQQMETLGVVVSKADSGNFETTMTLPGEVVLNDDAQAMVTPYISGYVKEIRKRQGDRVEKGEVMAVLESRELADAAALYLAARERLGLAKKTYEREASLWKKKISPETDYLESKMALSAARIDVRSARQKLMAMGLRKNAIDELPVRTDASLTRYEITSPLKGEVLHKNLTLGEMVESSLPVYRVADLKTVWVKMDVHQKQLPWLRKGMTVRVLGGAPTGDAEGVLTFIGPLVGSETRTASGRAILANPEGRWPPGLFVTVQISAGTKHVPLLVPKEAVQHVNDESVVFVPVKNGFEERIVATGQSDENHYEIISGLSPGDAYVSEGAFELKAALVTDALDSHAGHGH